MLDKIQKILGEINNIIIKDNIELENFKNKFLSKKGILNDLFEEFKNIPSEQKKDTGQAINTLKNVVSDKYNFFKEQFASKDTSSNSSDLTRDGEVISMGSKHPVTLVRNKIVSIFNKIGFSVSLGPEIEDDWHVFSALNFPDDHPARDMQDTFFIENKPDILLRTHTSSVQIRYMEKNKPPMRIIMPGRVFRNEAISARSHCMFHQIEGLYIDKKVSFADLKQCLLYFAKELYGEKTEIRLRPSYFPFTEPSAEMDISCTLCKGKGCNICKYSGWIEILGCGMVDPNVLSSCNIDPTEYSGFAFGMGLERIAMRLFEITDIRLLFENDVRLLNQFSSL